MKNMKRILCLLPAIFLFYTVFGCSEGHKATDENANVTTTAENLTDETLNKEGGVVGDALSVVSVSPQQIQLELQLSQR